MSTKDRLADDLHAANAPADMVIRARSGHYDDYDSPLATPIVALVKDCRRHGLYRIARLAKEGHYDATKEESEAWYGREGKRLAEDAFGKDGARKLFGGDGEQEPAP